MSPSVRVHQGPTELFVTWAGSSIFRGNETLRLIWSDNFTDYEGIYLASHQDFPLTGSETFFVREMRPKLFGYILMTPSAPLVIRWLEIQNYPEDLSVWQIFGQTVKNIRNAAEIRWRVMQRNVNPIYSNWKVKFTSPIDEERSVEPRISANGDEYSIAITTIECREYKGFISWRDDLIQSEPFSFRTAKPKFRATSFEGSTTDNKIILRWAIPNCTYEDAYFRIFVNDKLVQDNLNSKARFFEVPNLPRNKEFLVDLHSCFQGNCFSSKKALKTTISNLSSIEILPSVHYDKKISINCATRDNVDRFFYILTDNGREVEVVEKKNCLFVETCPCHRSLSISIAAGVFVNGSMVRCGEVGIPNHCNQCNFLLGWILLGTVPIILIATIFLFILLKRRRDRKLKNTNVILPSALAEIVTVEEVREGSKQTWI